MVDTALGAVADAGTPGLFGLAAAAAKRRGGSAGRAGRGAAAATSRTGASGPGADRSRGQRQRRHCRVSRPDQPEDCPFAAGRNPCRMGLERGPRARSHAQESRSDRNHRHTAAGRRCWGRRRLRTRTRRPGDTGLRRLQYVLCPVHAALNAKERRVERSVAAQGYLQHDLSPSDRKHRVHRARRRVMQRNDPAGPRPNRGSDQPFIEIKGCLPGCRRRPVAHHGAVYGRYECQGKDDDFIGPSGEHRGWSELMPALAFANLVGVLCSEVRVVGWPRLRPTFFACH